MLTIGIAVNCKLHTQQSVETCWSKYALTQGTVSIWDAVLGDKGRRPAGHADDQVLFHTARMTLHRCKHESDRTRCGKVITNVYKVISDEPHFDYPRCKMCFGSAA